MAKAYTYDSKTKKYIEEIDVPTGKDGEWLLPPYSTMTKPPVVITAGKELYWYEKLAGNGEAVSSGWAERDIPVEEQEEAPLYANETIPEHRQRTRILHLLETTDYTQLLDFSGGETLQLAWREWRAAIRNLPSTDGWPDSINWPTPPAQIPGVKLEQAEREWKNGTFTTWDNIDNDPTIMPISWTQN